MRTAAARTMRATNRGVGDRLPPKYVQTILRLIPDYV